MMCLNTFTETLDLKDHHVQYRWFLVHITVKGIKTNIEK